MARSSRRSLETAAMPALLHLALPPCRIARVARQLSVLRFPTAATVFVLLLIPKHGAVMLQLVRRVPVIDISAAIREVPSAIPVIPLLILLETMARALKLLLILSMTLMASVLMAHLLTRGVALAAVVVLTESRVTLVLVELLRIRNGRSLVVIVPAMALPQTMTLLGTVVLDGRLLLKLTVQLSLALLPHSVSCSRSRKDSMSEIRGTVSRGTLVHPR